MASSPAATFLEMVRISARIVNLLVAAEGSWVLEGAEKLGEIRTRGFSEHDDGVLLGGGEFD
jgi:hypothetical protein